MLFKLTPQQLNITINPQELGFHDTSELAPTSSSSWIGQEPARKAAQFGLGMRQPGFHLLVLGEPGSGRTSLMLAEMQANATTRDRSADLILLHHFATPEKPLVLYVQSGRGAELRVEMDQFIRQIARLLPLLLSENLPANDQAKRQMELIVNDQLSVAAVQLLDTQLLKVQALAQHILLSADKFQQYLAALKRDVLDNLELFQPNPDGEGLLEGFLSRYRVNLLVDNRQVVGAPVIYDDDPSFQSLFGGYEASNDNATPAADFMRVRAGNLLRAHGGMLMLHLRDIRADQQNGSQILEKLQRVLRNHHVQIEESAGSAGQNAASHFAPEALPVEVKLVLIATREEYYELQDELPDFARYFRIKVDFTERFQANRVNYLAIAQFVSGLCERHALKPFSVEAVTGLIGQMQRRIDDQTRISANFAYLQGMVLESAAYAELRQASGPVLTQLNQGGLVELVDVQAALEARHQRHQHPEQQLREAIVDGELLIQVSGRQIGQINGLTHIDLGDASFGSPVSISARCYAGLEGVINIDREVEMTGPNHDKGLYILRSWLAANFANLTPLSLTASLVFEQEYHGVEGDSASCAELYALLSALSGLSLPQGLAVTGALNQHGRVMSIGGVNEKIEGYFRVCQYLGLDGSQGVVIPGANRSHLLLNAEVISAVTRGEFNIYTMDSLLEGMSLLTGLPVDAVAEDGNYQPDTVMGRVQEKLKLFQKLHASNHPWVRG